MTELRIGTSGFSYQHWRGRYYPASLRPAQWLTHYMQDFDTVELNNSFYRLPEASSFEQWRRSTPARFVFAVKGSQFLTHRVKLRNPERGLTQFISRAGLLRSKLGPILWQLPPRWKVNAERLEAFLRALPAGHRYTFELRDQSWIQDDVLALLQRYNAAFCIYDLGGYQSPLHITADWTYVRLHGPTAFRYQGSYSTKALESWARRMNCWAKTLKAIYLYFDNDDSAFAVRNAIALKRLITGIGPLPGEGRGREKKTERSSSGVSRRKSGAGTERD